MIDIQNLTFRYGRRKANVFEGLTLQIPEGGVYGLLGKNGEGKTTLLYLLSGLLRPTSGSVRVAGAESQQRKAEMLREIFIVGEDFQLPATRLSMYLRAIRHFYPRFSDTLLDRCLSDFGLPADPSLGELSMGQKKKVYISIALAAGTKFLFMDEPTNGLDIPSKEQFRRVVASAMDEERTLILSTHQVHDIDVLLDHVTVLGGGRLLLNASTEEICRRWAFEIWPSGEDTSQALIATPTLAGNAVMVERGERPETPLNLELLFNFLTK